MEIHAPESPIHSIKDFLLHISVVTVGILIALGLEGLREAVHNRHLVRETRENVHTEMGSMREQAKLECNRVSAYSVQVNRLEEAMPALAEQHADQLATGLNSDSNPGYFLSANSYEVALSTGVLAHLPTPEISAYAYAAEGTKTYTMFQQEAVAAERRIKAYLKAYPHPSANQIGPETEMLSLFAREETGLAYVCPQMEEDLDRAFRASEH